MILKLLHFQPTIQIIYRPSLARKVKVSGLSIENKIYLLFRVKFGANIYFIFEFALWSSKDRAFISESGHTPVSNKRRLSNPS
jgi:hypothetical protein